MPPSQAPSRRSSMAASVIGASPSTNRSSRREAIEARTRNLTVQTSAPSQTPRLRTTLSSSSLRSAAASSRAPTSPGLRMQSSKSPSVAGSPSLHRKNSSSSLRSGAAVSPMQTPNKRSSTGASVSPLARSPLHSAHPPTIDEAPSAEAIAADHFQSDLAAHGSADDHRRTDLVVVMNDACYGHRFSRPRTTRNNLNTIVERPERVRAAALGVAMAYVRLGGRHPEGHNPIHPRIHPTSFDRIPFRIRKTDRRVGVTTPVVTNVHGQKWMEELKMMCEASEAKLAGSGKELQRPDIRRDAENKNPPKLHEGDLYLCGESLDAFEGALGAVCDAVDTVFSKGPRRAFVGVRPPGHHCSASLPSGFCWINNVHVGIMHAAMNHDLTHAAIIDIDLHHGDGSQDIAWKHNKRAEGTTKSHSAWKRSHIGYFSIHDINSYPCEQGDEEKVRNASVCIDGAHGQHVWNMHLQPWKTELEFWHLYKDKYLTLLDKARVFLRAQTQRLLEAGQEPKSAIFISAGFDASEWESAGMQRHKVNVPTSFYAKVAQDIVRLAAEEGTSTDGRVISVMEGGYSDRALSSGVLSHLSGLAGDQLGEDASPFGSDSLASEMRLKIGISGEPMDMDMDMDLDESILMPERDLTSLHAYDPSWWSRTELERIEALLAPKPVIEPKKPKVATTPTYFSPTQASSARQVEPRLRKTLSNMSMKEQARPVTPPPPDVEWEVAAFELVKQLIPLDRTTESYQFEELNADAARVKKEKAAAAPAPSSSRMSLRERKPKTAPVESASSQASRRRTVSTTVLADKKPKAPVSRRVSAAPAMQSRTPDPAPARGRPVNAIAARPQPGGTLSVKKSRANLASSPTPTQSTSSRSPVHRPTTASSIDTSRTASRSSTIRTRPSTSSPTSMIGDDSLENLTTGMKKIRINLITREQREARARAESAMTNRTTESGSPIRGSQRSGFSSSTARRDHRGY